MSNTKSIPNPERAKKPANIYYVVPYFARVLCSYVFIGSFTLAWVADYLTLSGKIWMWTAFALSCALAIAIHPTIATEKIKFDEKGCPVKVRRPLVGFKKWEYILDVEGIENGHYEDLDGQGNTDPRIHDGYRYTFAWIRI
ncbi:hypothetical protein N7508_006953 [Penicillium antarcticum]|uniref:uncharacterized protein n=1 Tax=Penicillium antarcticum TaxID=416450 RepID=UPI0023928459|nr:uncharacterized protein N7508_006953 [Penicillium antarcticum]KAJ5302090.1 hypothetical protein N7508_006953 [Penicillium antarcticum]